MKWYFWAILAIAALLIGWWIFDAGNKMKVARQMASNSEGCPDPKTVRLAAPPEGKEWKCINGSYQLVDVV